ncbi:hypothetical protein CS542_05125 [Pedobacter sp. IW39]|nr:hypothetical protein CS542_05125 [Pedobacter sp. IW39]
MGNCDFYTGSDGIPFFYAKENEFAADGLKVVLPKGTLYNDFNLVYKVKPEPQRCLFTSLSNS